MTDTVLAEPVVMRNMRAELLFLDTENYEHAVKVLEALGYRVEKLDWKDPCSDKTRWIYVYCRSELTQDAFLSRMLAFADLFDGDAVEAGYEDEALRRSIVDGMKDPGEGRQPSM